MCAHHKPVLAVRLSAGECDALRAIASELASERSEPVSLAAAVRGIVRNFIRQNGGVAGELAEGTQRHGERRQH
jgi:hypothetical protein